MGFAPPPRGGFAFIVAAPERTSCMLLTRDRAIHMPGGHFFRERTSQNAVKPKFAE
jgi:hypothetical protein